MDIFSGLTQGVLILVVECVVEGYADIPFDFDAIGGAFREAVLVFEETRLGHQVLPFVDGDLFHAQVVPVARRLDLVGVLRAVRDLRLEVVNGQDAQGVVHLHDFQVEYVFVGQVVDLLSVFYCFVYN